MSFDIKTLSLALFLISFVQILSLLALIRMIKKYTGPGWWMAGITAITLGSFALVLRAVPQLASLAILCNNLLFVSSFLLFYAGILRFFDRREPGRLMLTFLGLYALVDIIFIFIYPDILSRGTILYLTIVILSLANAWALWKYRPKSLKISANFLIFVFILHSFIFLIGMVLGFVTDYDQNPIGQNPAQVLGILDALTITTLWTFGFILIINQRLNVDNREAMNDLELIFNASPDAIFITQLNNGKLIDCNEGFTSLTGFTREDSIGKTTLEISLWERAADRQSFVEKIEKEDICSNIEYTFRKKNNQQLIGVISARKIMLKGVEHILCVLHDVTERKLMEDKLHQLATTDELTGIYNRRHFLEQTQLELKRSLRLNHPFAIAWIDLDNFKKINDRYGHASGDQALKHLVKIFQGFTREIDVFARIGGDEFALVMPETDGKAAFEIIERLRFKLISTPIYLAGAPVTITFSAGVTELKGETDTNDALFKRADQALYAAKQAGRNQTSLAGAGLISIA